MMKKMLLPLLIFILVLSIASCKTNEEEEVVKLVPGNDLKVLNDIQFDFNKAFFDDFSSGVDPEKWFIADQAWGGANGGVIP